MVGASGGGSSSTQVVHSSRDYGDTTTTNPYVISHTNNKGTTTTFNPNTSLQDIFDFTNTNVNDLLNQYLNPSTESPAYQAQLKQYQKNLEESTRQALENNVIAPLAQRNMIRSSQATDLYNTLNKRNQNSLDNFNAELLANSKNDTANVINNLMNLVYQGWNVVNGNQAQSLNTSSGNSTGTTTSHSTGTNYSLGGNFLYS